MKQVVFLFMILSFVKCQNKTVERELDSNTIIEINKIVEAVILQDSLDVFKGNENNNIFLNELKKITVQIPNKNRGGSDFPPISGHININDLLNIEIMDEIFFSSKDSIALLEQNSFPEKLEINKAIFESFNLIILDDDSVLNKSKRRNNYYILSIPIFSLDKQKAYVELEYYCGGLCGSGKGIYLKKINGNWFIIEKSTIWMS